MSQREGALGPWFEKGQDGESRPGWRERESCPIFSFSFISKPFSKHFKSILFHFEF
jgi:hypothetical protein